MQTEAMPRFRPCLCKAPSKVTMIRAPDAPIGCPRALAAYEATGGAPAMFEAYTAGEKDYTALVTKLKAA